MPGIIIFVRWSLALEGTIVIFISIIYACLHKELYVLWGFLIIDNMIPYDFFIFTVILPSFFLPLFLLHSLSLMGPTILILTHER